MFTWKGAIWAEVWTAISTAWRHTRSMFITIDIKTYQRPECLSGVWKMNHCLNKYYTHSYVRKCAMYIKINLFRYFSCFYNLIHSLFQNTLFYCKARIPRSQIQRVKGECGLSLKCFGPPQTPPTPPTHSITFWGSEWELMVHSDRRPKYYWVSGRCPNCLQLSLIELQLLFWCLLTWQAQSLCL